MPFKDPIKKAEYHRNYNRKWEKAKRPNRVRDSETDAEYQRRYREKIKPTRTAYHREYRIANPPTKRDRERARQWTKEHPEAVRSYWNRRRARLKESGGRGVTPEGWQEVLDGSLGICVYCNERKPLTMEHIEPISKGGAHDIENIAAACMDCNRSKRDQTLVVWLAKRTKNNQNR